MATVASEPSNIVTRAKSILRTNQKMEQPSAVTMATLSENTPKSGFTSGNINNNKDSAKLLIKSANYKSPITIRGSELKDGGCACGADLFNRFLGPTADEAILSGVQMIVNLYSRLKVCDKDESGDEDEESGKLNGTRLSSNTSQSNVQFQPGPVQVSKVVSEILQSIGVPSDVAAQIVQSALDALEEERPVTSSRIRQTSIPQMMSQILQTLGLSSEMASEIVQTSFESLLRENPTMASHWMQTSSLQLSSAGIQTSATSTGMQQSRSSASSDVDEQPSQMRQGSSRDPSQMRQGSLRDPSLMASMHLGAASGTLHDPGFQPSQNLGNISRRSGISRTSNRMEADVVRDPSLSKAPSFLADPSVPRLQSSMERTSETRQPRVPGVADQSSISLLQPRDQRSAKEVAELDGEEDEHSALSVTKPEMSECCKCSKDAMISESTQFDCPSKEVQYKEAGCLTLTEVPTTRPKMCRCHECSSTCFHRKSRTRHEPAGYPKPKLNCKCSSILKRPTVSSSSVTAKGDTSSSGNKRCCCKDYLVFHY